MNSILNVFKVRRGMQVLLWAIIIIPTSLILASCKKASLPTGFVYLADIDPTIIQSARYCGSDNFMGRPVAGYEKCKIVATKKAALQLRNAHAELKQLGYKLVIYDAYRPERAVNDFVAWAERLEDNVKKAEYYPYISKTDLFTLGYIASTSSHSRGSTFDLTIIKKGSNPKPIVISDRVLKNGQLLKYLDDNTVDMGSSFDLFHEISHHDTSLITAEQLAHRNLLRDVMARHGFKSYPQEWWHYTLEGEPFPTQQFDFVVE